MYAKPRAAGVVAKTDGMLWKLDRAAFRRLQSGANLEVDVMKVLRKVRCFVRGVQHIACSIQGAALGSLQLLLHYFCCSSSSSSSEPGYKQ